ncbi:hypothetical protein B9Z19DRAFT_894218, partial [Tuber borchii]
IRGRFYLDLARRENDIPLWITSWKGSYNDRSKCSELLREAVELLLDGSTGLHNFNISHIFQNDNRRRVRYTISRFQDLVDILIDIGISVGCLTGGSRPISRGLKSTYLEHQRFFKNIATLSEAVRFLSIGHRLKSGQVIQDFMFTVLSGFEIAFPKFRAIDGAPPGQSGQRNGHENIGQELWEYLKRQHREYQRRKREREKQLRRYLGDMRNSPDNSIFLSVRPSALIDLASLASASVKSRTQAWEMQNPGQRDHVVVEVKTIGNGNSHRARRDPNRERERHHDREQFEHALVQNMNQFAQEERHRRYDNILPWEVHLRG